MANAVLTWNASPSPNVQQYTVSWNYNGAPVAVVNIPETPAGDAGGYTADFNTANPTITLKSGDAVSASIVAVDTVDNLTSGAVTAGPVTIPVSTPLPPVNVVLVIA